MQIVKFFLRAEGVRARNLDSYGAPSGIVPYITRGMAVELELHLREEDRPYPDEILTRLTAWEFAVAHDWDVSTPPLIRVNSGITAEPGGVVRIILTNTNTAELIEALNGRKEAIYGGELTGYQAGDDTPAFLIQFDIGLRNRLSEAGTGTPEPVGDGSLSASQIVALVDGAGVSVESPAGAVLVPRLKKIVIGAGLSATSPEAGTIVIGG